MFTDTYIYSISVSSVYIYVAKMHWCCSSVTLQRNWYYSIISPCLKCFEYVWEIGLIWTQRKEKGSHEKPSLITKLLLDFCPSLAYYKIVSWRGCSPRWNRQQFRRSQIEIIKFLAMPFFGICRARWMLCAWYLEQFPGSRIEIVVFLVMKKRAG